MAELPFAFSPSAPQVVPPPQAAAALAAPALANSETPAIPAEPPSNLEAIVRIAFDNNASDIHLGVAEVPRFRHRGDIVATPWPVTEAEIFRDWLREVLDPGQLDSFKREKEFDGQNHHQQHQDSR
jgi:twitching motility protein PilT